MNSGELLDEIDRLESEIARLKRGEFTPEEIQDILHASTDTSRRQWIHDIDLFTRKLLGFAKCDPEERERFKQHFAGKTEPCCECGEEYPQADLAIDREIYCPKCRC